MKKTTSTPKLSNEGLANCFAGLEEALMADTLALKAMDEDIKVLNVMLKKLSFEMTGVTYLDLPRGDYKLGFDFDKKSIVCLKNGNPTPINLTAAPIATRKDMHAALDELLVHLRRKFENKAKTSTESTIKVSPASTPVQKPGLFGGTRQA